MMRRSARIVPPLALAALALTVGCGRKKNTETPIDVATVTRRNIIVTAQATGTVEPIDTVAVKSQASGLVTVMPVDVGTHVKPGDLLIQIDTRTLKNDYDRAAATQRAARATLTVDSIALGRANDLYAQKVITADEHESAVIAEANARSSLTSATMNLQTAEQNLSYATVRSEVSGTIISKTASVGTVVSSATSTYGGGSTIVTVADLSRVRMRALVNETDVGNVHSGMPVTVTVDAFPNRRFSGVVERVEPQATVQSSVTMFPVLVSLQNVDEALLPGMNGEVTIITQQRHDVLAVPNDAIRSMRDLPLAAAALGLNPDSAMAAARASRSTGAGRSSGAGNTTGTAGTMRTDSQRGAGMRRQGGTSGGMMGGAGMGAMGGGASANSMVVVFVKSGTSWTPKLIRTGVSDFDYSEVLGNNLQEGDQVALLGAALIQAQREAQSDRIRTMTGGGLPGTGSSTSRSGTRSGASTSTSTSGNARGGTTGGSSSGGTRGSGSGGATTNGGGAPPPPPPGGGGGQ